MTQSREKFRPTTKRDVIEMLERMPDDVSLEDIMYALYVRQKVDRGLKDAAEGRLIPHDEVMRKLDEWLQSPGQ
jgi:hypothetical protein